MMAVKKRYASSTDVARLAGVSQSAVSRTYKTGGSVSPETRRKVLAAAEELGYQPSRIPQIMLTHRSNLVAIVVGGFYNPFYSQVLEKFTSGLQARGHQALLVHADSGHMLDGAIPRLIGYRVDAIVSALSILSPRAADDLAQLSIPIISFNTPVHNEWITSVCCDNVAAGRAMADLFVERGAKTFGFISGPVGSPASGERLLGYAARLAELSFPAPQVGHGDFRYEGGMAAGLAMLGRKDRPRAIFCANDLVAMGTIDAARHRLGLKVPEDVMVAGFDDIPQASWDSYGLTTVLQDAARMTEEALRIVEEELTSHRDGRNERILVPATLIVRATVPDLPSSRVVIPEPRSNIRDP